MKMAAGGFGNRMGAAWSADWAKTRARRESGVTAHGSASLQETISAPSTEAMAASVEANICPFCAAGPYKSLGLHTHRAHGVSAAELREMTGLERVCSEQLSIDSRTRLEHRSDFEDLQVKATAASVEARAFEVAHAASMKLRGAVQAERDPIIAERAAGGERLIDIASDFAISVRAVRDSLARTQTKPTLARTNEERRERLAEGRSKAAATRARRSREDAEDRVARFQELGGGWSAMHILAAEVGVSPKSMTAYLRSAGIELPDGRAVTALRNGGVPAGTPNLACRGLGDEDVALARALRDSGMSQKAIAERLGTGQSTISRALSGRYVNGVAR